MWKVFNTVSELFHRLNRLDDYSTYGDATDIISTKLQDEIRTTVYRWQKEIRKKFEIYMLKQANLMVLEKKRNEL